MAELKSLDLTKDTKSLNDVAKTMAALYSTYHGFVKTHAEIIGFKREANMKVAEISGAMSETLMMLHDTIESQEVKEMIRSAAKDLADKIKTITQK